MSVARATGRVATRTVTRTGWVTARLALRLAVATAVGAAFGWVGDLPRNVNPDPGVEDLFARRAQVTAAIAWPVAAVLLAVRGPVEWAVAVAAFATLVLMRRIMASRGHGWPPRRLVRDSRFWLARHRLVTAAAVLLGVGFPVFWATTDAEVPQVHAFPVLVALSLGAFVAWREASWRTRSVRLLPRLAQVCKVTESVMETALLRPRSGKGFTMVTVPPQVVTHLDGLDERLALHLPEFEADVRRDLAGTVTSIEFRPTGVETVETRDLLNRTGGLVTGLTLTDTGNPARPDEHLAHLTEAVSPTMAARVDAALEPIGFTVVEWLPAKRVAHVARLHPKAAAIRSRLAGLLACEPHAVEVALTHTHDEKMGRDRLDTVTVLRAPAKGTSAEKRAEVWRDLVLTLPDGSSGWKVAEDLTTGVVTLTFGQPRVLPGLVPMGDLLPRSLDTSDWATIPLGVTPEGAVASIDLTAGPHAMVVGPTGSGKSILLRQHAVSALAHGHDLIVIDAIKDGLDFLAFKPWAVAFSQDGVTGARAVIEAVYAEGVRRKAVLRAFEAPSWVDLPADIRRREGIKPLTVLFDEFMSACIASPVPKGLDKDDPLVEEANRLNSDKATVLAMVGKIARELRFTGIFLVVAMQRPDASLLSGFGEIRSNLTSAVQLVKPGSLPAQETLRMVFPGDQTAVAAETIMELDDGSSKGLGTVGADGGDVLGFRVGFGTPAEVREHLEALAVPEATPWTIEVPDAGDEPGAVINSGPRPPAPAPAVPQVVDLGSVEFSLDDLEDLTAEDEPAPVADLDDDWADPAPALVVSPADDDDDDWAAPAPSPAVAKVKASIPDDLWG